MEDTESSRGHSFRVEIIVEEHKVRIEIDNIIYLHVNVLCNGIPFFLFVPMGWICIYIIFRLIAMVM